MTAEPLALMALELWKLIRSYERSLVFLPIEHQAKTKAQVRFSSRRLDSLLEGTGIRLVSFEGQVFEPNLPVTAVNAEDFDDSADVLVVERTIEPAVMNDSKLVMMGKVVLIMGGKNVSGN